MNKPATGVANVSSSSDQLSAISYRQLFDNMSSCVAIYEVKNNGADFIFKDVNKAAEIVDHVKKKDIIGKSVLKIFPGVGEFGLFAVFQRVWRTGKPEHFPLKLYKDNRISGWKQNYVYKLPNGDIVVIYDDITEQKKAEYLASVSESRYRRLFETAKDGILLIDFETGMILDVNPFLIDLLDYSKKDFLKKYLWEVGVFKDIAASKENFKTLQEKRYVRFEDLPLETKAGKKIDVEFVANAYEVDSTTVIQCNIRDITKRKFVESLIQKNEAYLRATLDCTADGILAIDNHRKILHTNNRFTEFWKIPDSLIKTKDDKKLLSYVLGQLVDPQGFITKVESLYKSKKTSFDEIKFKDGRVFERYSTPLIINQQNEGRVWSFRDVSQRVKYEKEIMEAKAKSDAILSSIGDAVFACDTKGTIVLFNTMAETMTGMKAEDAVGKHYNNTISFIRESTGKPSNDFIAEAIKYNKITKMANHVLLVRSDGRTIPVADSAAPIHTKDGMTFGCVVVFHDVTREREIDKAKTEFVSLASHQLRTPLSTINWYSETLLSKDLGTLSPKQRKYAEEVHHASDRMVSLVNALLNVSRLELGSFAVEPEFVNPRNIISDSITELNQQITKKNITVKETYDEQFTSVKADPKLFEIIVDNLLSNAVKYSYDGGVIRIAIKKDHDDIVLSVSDTGVGIPKEDQENIFTKLFRASNAKKIDPDGAGLGLYIIKEILEHSNGKVWFESSDGKGLPAGRQGTTFYVTLPVSGMIQKAGERRLI